MSWYNEITKPGYNFNAPGYQPGAGHFSALVWVASTQVGCARCSGPYKYDTWDGTETYIGCNFSPTGNINTPAYFSANVIKNNTACDKNVIAGF